MNFRHVCLVVLTTLLAAGCGGAPERPSTAKVTGKVSLGGKPLADAIVTFHPQIEGGGRMATGQTDAGGNFVLSCFDKGDGAIIGKHKVTITAGAPASESNDPAALEAAQKQAASLPEKFAKPETSPIDAEVGDDESQNTFDWDLDKL
ncbi:MAG: hypothetical protein R3B90_07455 [Planctomycetaceae bacterium]